MTAEAYIQDFQKERRPSTIRAAKLAVTTFEQWRKGRPIDAALIREWRDSLRGKPGYRTLTVSHVRSYVSWLDDREIEAVPAKALKELRAFKAEKRLIQTFTMPELRALAEAAVAQGANNVLAVLLTGCRRNELAGMSCTLEGLKISGFKTRTERLWPWWLIGSAAPLFRKRLTPIRQEWKLVRAAANVRRYPVKALRSTLATRMVAWPRFTLYQVATLLGNSHEVLASNYLGNVTLDKVEGETVPEILGIDDLFTNP